MASTYVNNLRLNEMATGDASGTWGTTTNTNLELIGEALGYGTEAITTNADTHTSTVADGASDAARAMYVKYTGTLDSACTITIAPNTMKRVQVIENATSGSQNIIISQGSGANITIPPGDTKMIYLDGAGSGAAVVDAFASLSVVDLKVQDDLTVTDDMTVGGTLGVTGIVTLTDDLIIGDGKTIGSASDVDAMTIASNGQVTFSQTLIGTALDISGDIDVDGTTNLDVVDIDGAVDMATTLTLGGNADFNGDLDVDGTTNLDVVDIDGAVDMASTLQVDGAITSSAGATITVADNSDNLTIVSTDADATTGPNVNFYRNSSSPADNDHLGEIRFTGRNDNSQDVIYSNIETRIKDASDGTEDGYFDFETMLNGTLQSRLLMNEVATIVNEDSLDIDFRVESNGDTHMIFVDAGNDRVGIATASPASKLHIDGAEDSTGGITLTAGAQAHNWYLASDFVNVHDIGTGSASAAHTWHINGSEKVRIDASGDLGVGVSSPSTKLHIQDADYTTMSIQAGTTSHGAILNLGDSGDIDYGSITQFASSAGENGRMRFIAGTTETMNLAGGKVGIGTTAPTYELDVAGDIGVDEYIYHNDDTNTYMRFTADALTIRAGGDDRFLITTSAVTISGVDGQVTKTSSGGNGGAFLIRNPSSGSGSYCRLYISPTANDATDRCTMIQGENTDGNNNMAMVFKISAGDAPAEAARFDSTGRFLVGLASASGSASANLQARGTGNAAAVFDRTSDGVVVGFKRNGGSDVGNISIDSSSTAYNTSSDARLKDVTGKARGLEVINKLNPVAYNWKADGKADEGLIAQEVQEIVPNAVCQNDEKYYQMDYSKLVTPLIKAVQEQQEQIDALKSEINLLKGE